MSEDIQVFGVKKGFNTGRALVGGLVAGPLGLLAGSAGSNKQETKCICNHCGQIFDFYQREVRKEAESPEEEAEAAEFNKFQEDYKAKSEKNATTGLIVSVIVLFFMVLACCAIA
jgi:uncharacterized membrane protein YvbJ